MRLTTSRLSDRQSRTLSTKSADLDAELNGKEARDGARTRTQDGALPFTFMVPLKSLSIGHRPVD